MPLLPDPATAASERSSVKNRLTGSRRRGSGINRHRSRTFSKTSLRGPGTRCRRIQRESRGGSRRSSGVQRGPGEVRGAGPETLQPAVKHEKLDKRSGLSVKPNMQLHPGLCAGGSSRTNGSRYPLGARRGLPRRLHQLLHGFFTKSQVKSFQNHLPSWALYCSYRAPSPASFKLPQPQNVSKGDFLCLCYKSFFLELLGLAYLTRQRRALRGGYLEPFVLLEPLAHNPGCMLGLTDSSGTFV